MRRILALAAASTAGLALATTATGHAACTKTFDRQMIVRAVHAEYRGTRSETVEDRRNVRRFIRCARPNVSQSSMRRYRLAMRSRWLERRQPSGYDSPVLADVPGVPWSFAACVAFRESDNGTMGDTVYGIIPASGFSVEGAPLSVQKHAFHDLYARDGTAPWSQYDGC